MLRNSPKWVIGSFGLGFGFRHHQRVRNDQSRLYKRYGCAGGFRHYRSAMGGCSGCPLGLPLRRQQRSSRSDPRLWSPSRARATPLSAGAEGPGQPTRDEASSRTKRTGCAALALILGQPRLGRAHTRPRRPRTARPEVRRRFDRLQVHKLYVFLHAQLRTGDSRVSASRSVERSRLTPARARPHR